MLLARLKWMRPAGRLQPLTTAAPAAHASRLGLLRQHLLAEGNGGRRAVGYWLLGTSGLVAGLVVLGGLTRLTESGLSMVDWRLVHFRAPQSEPEWQAYFEKYQQFPEYQLNNRGMALDDFKRIYWMEHAHRVYGRLLGLVIIGPSVFFAARRWVSRPVGRVLFGLCGLVGFQGLLGWYMVQSGLKQELVTAKEPVRVSQYRLAAHLGSAFALYLGLLNTGLRILMPPVQQLAAGSPARRLRFAATGVSHLILTTAVAGAFVAGLDAGMIYSTFPAMGAGFVPDDIWDRRLAWRNPFENPATAQFVHRCLAYTSVAGATGLWAYARRHPQLPRHIRALANVLVGVVWAQGSLGLLTLLYVVPVPLASAHQAGSLVALTSAAVLLQSVKRIPKLVP